MHIKDMFKNRIDRDLKGVIKVGQADEENVKQELEEYVVTKELQKHFADFFSNYKKGIVGNTDKMGVWISGFFGSGKSHFLKILSYLIENRVVDGKTAINYFIDDNKIDDGVVLGDIKLAAGIQSDVILFNIDSKSSMADSQNNKEAILSVFLKVFNQHLGYYGANPFIADLERHLSEEGKYEKFKKVFSVIRGKEWLDSRQQFRFIQDQICEALVTIDYMSPDAAKNWCESATGTYDIDIETFSKMIKQYIDSKDNNHHVIFLVDEIGQYIGEDSQLMLNLQTVTEDLGTACGGKAWIIVTSQQDIDSITRVRGNDFSKIQGRFDTRLSLSSANVDEVIEKRILEKKESANQTLKLLYDEKDTIIKNLITFTDGAEKKLYADRDKFAAVYPFVPYQFNLLGSVLTSIRTHSSSGKHLAEGERSMLALFKEAAERLKEETEGAIVPFNMFYDGLEKFLDHSHRGVISRGLDNEYLNPEKAEDCFDVNVLKVLFLIKNIKEVEANVDNITSLMVSHIDEDRITLKEKVEQALSRLIKQTLVQKNGDMYVFLTDEEQEINREINNQHLENAELIAKVSEMIFDGLYGENKYRYPAFSGRYSFGFNQFVDDRPYKNNQNQEISLKILTPIYENAMDEATLRMMSGQSPSVILALPDDRVFIDEIRSALKIEKYLKGNTFNILPKHMEIREIKKGEMIERTNNAKIFLGESLRNADIYSKGDKLDIGAKDISSRINEAIGKLVGTVFHKLSYIDTPVGEAGIKVVLKGGNEAQISLDDVNQTPNRLALADALDFIYMNSRNHDKTSMKAVMDRFTKAPYGFIEDDVSFIIARLFRDGDISLSINNESVSYLTKSTEEIYRYLSRKEFLEKLLIQKRKKATDRQKKIVRDVMKELFNLTPASEEDDAILGRFHECAAGLKNDLEKLEIHYKNEPTYPGLDVIKAGKSLMLDFMGIKSSAEFFKTAEDKEDDLLEFAEKYEPIKAFFSGEQIEIWDRGLRLMKIYDVSKGFFVNSRIEEVVNEVNSVMEKAAPYSHIKNLPGLLDDYTILYSTVLTDMEGPIQIVIDEARQRVEEDLEKRLCKDEFVEPVADRFTELKKKAESCNNVATLQNIKVEADALKVRFLNEISKAEAKLVEDKPPVNPEDDSDNGGGIVPPKPKIQKTVSIKTINTQATWRIETEADVDKYVEALKTKLKQEIKEDLILNIEF